MLFIHGLAVTTTLALPSRLVLTLDGISYRDMKALQAGVSYTDAKRRKFHRQAFNEGYFPVSRNISTFPSTSDVAWTDIFGDRPLPGYQRTYFSEAENREVPGNSVTTSMEHERQMHWQADSAYRRAMAYVYPLHTFKYELGEVTKQFLHSRCDGGSFYVYIRSTDDAQHTSGDVFALLALLDEKLKELRATYKARTGRDLEILLLSDHGNNHAGAGKRVEVRNFLKNAGYRVAKTIGDRHDVVLPTCGIESWVEIHNLPAETETLAQLLWHLEGVDLLMARLPDQNSHFLVINAKGERAVIDWNPAKNAYRYSTDTGDPLNYNPVIAALRKKNQLDAKGFATADSWMAATMTNHYPLALERIVQGLTRITLNPANIILSLSNGYVHANWLINKSSRLMTQGGTHGNLDDINSDGMVLANFKPTQDTSTGRVAGQFDDFQNLRNYRAEENGAEWAAGKEQALTRIARAPFDSACRSLPDDAVCLRIWSPEFANLAPKYPVEITIEKVVRYSTPRIRRWDPKPADSLATHLTLTRPISVSDDSAYERVYALPPDLSLEPGAAYRISGRIPGQEKPAPIFKFGFRTDNHGMPVAY